MNLSKIAYIIQPQLVSQLVITIGKLKCFHNNQTISNNVNPVMLSVETGELTLLLFHGTGSLGQQHVGPEINISSLLFLIQHFHIFSFCFLYIFVVQFCFSFFFSLVEMKKYITHYYSFQSNDIKSTLVMNSIYNISSIKLR